jgi:hypothetical protein
MKMFFDMDIDGPGDIRSYLLYRCLPILLAGLLIIWLSGGLVPPSVSQLIDALTHMAGLMENEGNRAIPKLIVLICQVLALVGVVGAYTLLVTNAVQGFRELLAQIERSHALTLAVLNDSQLSLQKMEERVRKIQSPLLTTQKNPFEEEEDDDDTEPRLPAIRPSKPQQRVHVPEDLLSQLSAATQLSQEHLLKALGERVNSSTTAIPLPQSQQYYQNRRLQQSQYLPQQPLPQSQQFYQNQYLLQNQQFYQNQYLTQQPPFETQEERLYKHFSHFISSPNLSFEEENQLFEEGVPVHELYDEKDRFLLDQPQTYHQHEAPPLSQSVIVSIPDNQPSDETPLLAAPTRQPAARPMETMPSIYDFDFPIEGMESEPPASTPQNLLTTLPEPEIPEFLFGNPFEGELPDVFREDEDLKRSLKKTLEEK